MFNLKRQNIPISEQRIKDFEIKFNLVLSREYKSFLMTYNGGDCFYNLIFKFNHEYYSPIRMLMFYNIQIIDELFEELKCNPEEDFYDNIPKNMLMIGCDYRDIDICISCDNENNGKIYCTDKYFINEDGNKYILIANSFNEFLDKFEEDTQ